MSDDNALFFLSYIVWKSEFKKKKKEYVHCFVFYYSFSIKEYIVLKLFNKLRKVYGDALDEKILI